MIIATGVDHFSPLVPSNLQYNTSSILYWQETCQTTNLDECVLLQPFYEAFNTFREATPGAGAYFNEADYFEKLLTERLVFGSVQVPSDPVQLFP